jgi:hypothetical protein
LALPGEETVPIHVEADGDELAALLGVFVSDGALTKAEADGIAAAVRENAGHIVRIADFIPPSWSPYVLTHQQMEAGGWFPHPSGP